MEKRRENSTETIHGVRQTLYKSIGWNYRSPGDRPEILENLKKWRMIGSNPGGFEFHGSLSGIGANGQAFRIADVTDTGFASREKLFKGAIISFKQAELFVGRTIVNADKGVYNPTTIDLMTRIAFKDADFENMFEVYSDGKDSAETLFTSGFLQKMTVLSQETLGRRLQSCLIGDEIHFILDIDESFSFSKTYDQAAPTKFKRELVVEAGSICVLLEQLYAIQACLGNHDTAKDRQDRLAYYKKRLSKMMETAKTLNISDLKNTQAKVKAA